jgi:hypothetical protein
LRRDVCPLDQLNKKRTRRRNPLCARKARLSFLRLNFFGGGANEVIALSLRGGFIAEAISLRVEGIASVAIAP